MGDIMMLCALLLAIAIFLLPTIIAIKKNHPHKVGIILVNLIGSMFAGLGWVAALIWAFVLPKPESSDQV